MRVPSSADLRSNISQQKSALLNTIVKHQAQLKGGKTSESVVAMLGRLYHLTETHLSALMQLEIDGDDGRYAGWVNKHFCGLVKRQIPNQ